MRQTQIRGQPASTNADSNATELATATAFWSCAICGFLRLPRCEIKSHEEGWKQLEVCVGGALPAAAQIPAAFGSGLEAADGRLLSAPRSGVFEILYCAQRLAKLRFNVV